ncbi:MAG TPA: divalent metal cation transporter [Planctomycetota bacterium]|nr:divalent metal cation transporter [Planctomycetota bacterium]
MLTQLLKGNPGKSATVSGNPIDNAVAVLAGSSAFAVGELFDWPTGLEWKPGRARGFYAMIALGIGLGVLMNAVNVEPMRAWSAILNGLVAVPLLAALMRLATDRRLMGDWTPSPLLQGLG